MTGMVSFAIGPPDDPDRYELGEASGLGGESIVYRGARDGRAVAIKILRDDHQHRLDDFAELWMAQVELLRTLHHPGVVRPIEAFVGSSMHRVGHRPLGRSLCLVMDWVDGCDLDELRRSRRSVHDRSALLRALRQVADALDVMHSGDRTGGEPVVHGDIKPTNIRVTPGGDGVLVDFGLAGALVRKPTGGTPSYRAPESLTSGNSPATDVFGMGAVAAFLWTGSPPTGSPPTGASVSALPSPVVRALRPDARQRPEMVRPWLEEVVACSLAPDHDSHVSRVGARGAVADRLRWALIGVAASLLLVAAVAFAGGRNLADQPVELARTSATPPLATCDPVAWRAAAEESFPVAWADPDGDCRHTLVELNIVGSDPFEWTEWQAIGPVADVAWQARDIERLLVRNARKHDPIVRSSCSPEQWAAAALLWDRNDNPRSIPWDDPDGDCLTTDYELRGGTDPDDADSDDDGYLDSIDPGETNGLIPHQHRQLGLIIDREESAPAAAIAGSQRSAHDPLSRRDQQSEYQIRDR